MKFIVCVVAGVALAGCTALTEMPSGGEGVAGWLSTPDAAQARGAAEGADGSQDVDGPATSGGPACREVATTGTRFARTQRCTPARGEGGSLYTQERDRADREHIRDEMLLEEQRRIEREARERDHTSVLSGQ